MRILKIETLPSVKEAWIDRDMMLLHASFQILVDCIDKENLLNHCNFETYKETIMSLMGLYNWWKIRTDSSYNDNQDEDTRKLTQLIELRSFLWT